MDQLADIRTKDISESFLNLMQAYAPANIPIPKIHEFQQHMRDAATMSHYKYGWVKDKSYTHYKKLSTFEQGGFNKDKNLEHQVNIANYAMFRFITMPPEGLVYPAPPSLAGHGLKYEPAAPEVETWDDLIQIAVEALNRYVFPQEGEHYQGTDSDKSVVNTTHKSAKPKSVRAHLYDRFTSAYEFFEGGPNHFEY